MSKLLVRMIGFCVTLIILTSVCSAEQIGRQSIRAGWQLQDAKLVKESGEAISTPAFNPADWHAAVVPGTVLTSLVADGTYPDPLFGLNNDKIPDSLCRTDWWYRTAIEIPAGFANKKVWLRFDGINYFATVWVNGSEVGFTRGAFSRGTFDITPFAHVGQPNVIAVRISPQPNAGDYHKRSLAIGVGKNGGVSAVDGPTFLSSIGWDWQPTVHDRNTGIWSDVSLYSTGPVVVTDPYVSSTVSFPRLESADLNLDVTLRNTSPAPVKGTLVGEIDKTVFKQDVELNAGETKVLSLSPEDIAQLHIDHPRLWWPNGFGEQNLYNLHLHFETGSTTSDQCDVRFGIRQIAYAMSGSDNLALVVNGVPIVAKGGDWALNEAMMRIPRDRLAAEIRMHKQANYTIIRNWVGQSTCEDLYDLCDENGILMWDEFFQPNPSDGPNAKDIPVYLANVKEKLLRYRNHPCIALWCARNEGFPPKRIGDGIEKLIDVYDGRRLYQPSSTDGRGVHSSGPYRWRAPQEFYNIDCAFKTEIGSMSVPTLEAVKAMIPQSDWETIGDSWVERDFGRGAQGGDAYPETIADRYGEFSNLADFVRKSQLANYEAFRAMYEGRFSKLFAPCTGVITWMSNPSQPSFVWQLYSHDLEPNSSLFATQKACEPVHVQLNQNDWHMMVINNSPESLQGLRLRARIVNLDGKVCATVEKQTSAFPSAATDVGELVFPENLSAVHFIKLELTDAGGKPVSDNFYWRGNKLNDLKALDTLPAGAVQINSTRHDANGKLLIETTLTNSSTTPVVMAHVQLRKEKSSDRVLPVFYSDNYVSLLAGESKTISIEANIGDLAGQLPTVAVDGWNVTLNKSTGDVAAIANTAAVAHSLPATTAPSRFVLKIDSGGGEVAPFTFGTRRSPDTFRSDRFYQRGKVEQVAGPLDTTAANAAPEEIYRSQRWGECSYHIPVPANQRYLVRFHFVDSRFDAGGRRFDVLVNGKTVLRDLDIAGEAGKRKALVKDIPGIQVGEESEITIDFKRGQSDLPTISGIEVLQMP